MLSIIVFFAKIGVIYWELSGHFKTADVRIKNVKRTLKAYKGGNVHKANQHLQKLESYNHFSGKLPRALNESMEFIKLNFA